MHVHVRPTFAVRLVTPLLALSMLVACQPSGGAGVATSATIRGTATSLDDDAILLGAGLFMVDLASFVEVEPKGVSVTTSNWPVQAIEEGMWIASLTPTSTSGEFELVLPARSALPNELFVPSATFMTTIAAQLDSAGLECAFTSTAPTVKVTASAGGVAAVGPLATPAPFLIVNAELVLALTTTVAIGPGDEISELPFVTWVYAEDAVTVGIAGAECPPELIVDLPLRRGWNEVVWQFTEEAGSITRREPAPVFVTALANGS